MSRYGEPGPPYGGYPGDPDEPGGPRQPYDPPSDPWGQGGGDLTAPTPGHPPAPPHPADYPADYPAGYPAEPGSGYPVAPPAYPAQPPPGPPPGPPPDLPPGAAYPPGAEFAPGPEFPPGPVQGGWDPDPGPSWQGGAAPPWSADPEPGWAGADPEPPSRRRSGLLLVAVGLLVLVVAGAVAYALYLLSGDEQPSAGGAEPSGSAASGQATPPGTPEPGSTQNNIGLNAAMAREGDCLTNLGTEVEPQLQIVPCDSAENGPVYQVLAKVDSQVEGDNRSAQDASAQQLCGGTEGYTHHYFEISNSLSFVLCMAEQEPAESESESGSEEDGAESGSEEQQG